MIPKRSAVNVIDITIAVCWPWRLRHCGEAAHTQGAKCIYCGRDVAAPDRRRAMCIYCALDRGVIPAVDEPF